MLKWMVPTKSRDPAVSGLIPRVTDDPLAALNIYKKDPKNTRLAFSFKNQEEEIYSVTRVNPLFEEEGEMAFSKQESESRLGDDSHSNRSESKTPSSSGYESLVAHKHRHKTQQFHQGSKEPSNDYRRQLALGIDDRLSQLKDISLPRVGKATLLHQNRQYVSKIQMSPEIHRANIGRQAEKNQWPGYTLHSLPQYMTVPEPIWPSKTNETHHRLTGTSVHPRNLEPANQAIIEQNENYVTKILIAPNVLTNRTKENQTQVFPSDPFDSIITDSLLMWTSYELPEKEASKFSNRTMEMDQIRPSADAAIRELSETLSQSKTINTVSRAFISKPLTSQNDYSSMTAKMTISDTDYSSIDSKASFPSSKNSSSHSLAKRISLIRDLWSKSGMRANSRRLLIESDDEDHVTQYRTLDHEYVPRNGDINFSMDKRSTKTESFSSAAGVVPLHPMPKYESINEIYQGRQIGRFSPSNGQDHFDQDRLSNSSGSSRSSGSRRVTFSADTVDNEPSKSTSSNSSKNSSNPSKELKLDPQFLPRYSPPTQIDYNIHRETDRNTDGKRHGDYYGSNLLLYSENRYNKSHSGKMTGRPKIWENNNGAFGISSGPMDSYGNLQLHPNYPVACSENIVCVDFTMDSSRVRLLERKSMNEKLRRRFCCCLLFLLAVGVLIVVVVGISLYLTHGQKVFGSI